MRRAGVVVHAALTAVRATVGPGVDTGELDRVAADVIRTAGATPSFLGYGSPPFPAVICVSVNDEVVHGTPGRQTLVAGDVLSVDCGAIVDGWHGDAAFSMIVPGVAAVDRPRDAVMLAVTEQAMWAGISALAPGGRLGAVGSAIDDYLSDHPDGPWGIVEGYTGHGIGTEMHESPEVLNHRTRERGMKVRPGLCVAVEPMVTAGDADTRVLDDQWTVATVDGGRAAHFEHTVAVLDDGLWVLTAPDGGAAELSRRHIPVSAYAEG